MQHVNYSLRKVKLNRAGYDASGSYWGCDQPLYECEYREEGSTSVHSFRLRALSRDAAKDRAKAIIEATIEKRICLWRGNV